MELETKLENIQNQLKNKRIMVAFSGGADSTLLAKIAHDSAEEAVAVTVDNGVLPSDFIDNARKIAAKIGIPHKVLKENFIEDHSFRKNPPQRCYICKNKMYKLLEQYKKEQGFDAIVDGTNISDLLEDRPGIMVNYQKNIMTPLVYGGMNAEEVRTTLNNLNLEYSPSTTCYATRIPSNTEITTRKINRIEYAETLIKNVTGLKLVRVRDDQDQARIEISDKEDLLNNESWNKIKTELEEAGFYQLDVTNYGETDKELIIYKPCRDEANKIMFETELPYEIDIESTCKEMEKVGEVKCSIEMGVAMMELNGSNVTIFKKGKIVARRVRDEENAQDLMVVILPLLRRLI